MSRTYSRQYLQHLPLADFDWHHPTQDQSSLIHLTLHECSHLCSRLAFVLFLDFILDLFCVSSFGRVFDLSILNHSLHFVVVAMHTTPANTIDTDTPPLDMASTSHPHVDSTPENVPVTTTTPRCPRRERSPAPTTETYFRTRITPTKRADSVVIRAHEARQIRMPSMASDRLFPAVAGDASGDTVKPRTDNDAAAIPNKEVPVHESKAGSTEPPSTSLDGTITPDRVVPLTVIPPTPIDSYMGFEPYPQDNYPVNLPYNDPRPSLLPSRAPPSLRDARSVSPFVGTYQYPQNDLRRPVLPSHASLYDEERPMWRPRFEDDHRSPFSSRPAVHDEGWTTWRPRLDEERRSPFDYHSRGYSPAASLHQDHTYIQGSSRTTEEDAFIDTAAHLPSLDIPHPDMQPPALISIPPPPVILNSSSGQGSTLSPICAPLPVIPPSPPAKESTPPVPAPQPNVRGPVYDDSPLAYGTTPRNLRMTEANEETNEKTNEGPSQKKPGRLAPHDLHTIEANEEPSQKKPGRPTKEAVQYLDGVFAEVEGHFEEASVMTGHTVGQIIARWAAQNKGAKGTSSWDTYLKYFADNHEQESTRVENAGPIINQAFRAKCYAKYQEEYPDYEERLALFEELGAFNVKGMTVAQRKRAFIKYVGKLRRMVKYVHYLLYSTLTFDVDQHGTC